MQLRIFIRRETSDQSIPPIVTFKVTDEDFLRIAWKAPDHLILKINGEPHEFLDVMEFEIRKALDA